MITVEIMMIICFVLYGFALYIMYRYFNDIIDGMYEELRKDLNDFNHLCITKEISYADTIKSSEKEIIKLHGDIAIMKEEIKNTTYDCQTIHKIVNIRFSELEDNLKLNPEIKKPKTRKVRKENND